MMFNGYPGLDPMGRYTLAGALSCASRWCPNSWVDKRWGKAMGNYITVGFLVYRM